MAETRRHCVSLPQIAQSFDETALGPSLRINAESRVLVGIFQALVSGIGRVHRNLRLLAVLFVAGFVLVLPMAAAMSRILASAIGPSLVHENLRAGFDMDWYGEFRSMTGELGRTFSPSVVGAGAVLENVETFVEGRFFQGYAGISSLGLLYVLLWTFFAGGLIDAFHRAETVAVERFLAAAARHFLRLLQLVIAAGVFYYLAYRYVGRPLFRWIEDWTRNWTSERSILGVNAAAAVGVLILLAWINMAFDYAKIHAVVENRKNMLAAAWRGLAFGLAHPLKTFGLYCAAALLGILVVALYAVVAPGANQSSAPTVIAAFLIGQLYLLARIWVKLVFLASQTALMASLRPAPAPEPAPAMEPAQRPASETGFAPEPAPPPPASPES